MTSCGQTCQLQVSYCCSGAPLSATIPAVWPPPTSVLSPPALVVLPPPQPYTVALLPLPPPMPLPGPGVSGSAVSGSSGLLSPPSSGKSGTNSIAIAIPVAGGCFHLAIGHGITPMQKDIYVVVLAGPEVLAATTLELRHWEQPPTDEGASHVGDRAVAGVILAALSAALAAWMTAQRRKRRRGARKRQQDQEGAELAIALRKPDSTGSHGSNIGKGRGHTCSAAVYTSVSGSTQRSSCRSYHSACQPTVICNDQSHMNLMCHFGNHAGKLHSIGSRDNSGALFSSILTDSGTAAAEQPPSWNAYGAFKASGLLSGHEHVSCQGRAKLCQAGSRDSAAGSLA